MAYNWIMPVFPVFPTNQNDTRKKRRPATGLMSALKLQHWVTMAVVARPVPGGLWCITRTMLSAMLALRLPRPNGVLQAQLATRPGHIHEEKTLAEALRGRCRASMPR